jgi:DNA-binding ferritin-like protein
MANKGDATPPTDEHAARVQEAFDAFHEKLGEKLDGKARDSVEQLRAAAAEKDAKKIREHLGEVKERHGWLYRELAEHPAIATLLDELALWGF